MLETLYYPDEIRKNIEVDLESVRVSDKELDMVARSREIEMRGEDVGETQRE